MNPSYSTTARDIAETIAPQWHSSLPRNPEQVVHRCQTICGRRYLDGSLKPVLHVVLVDGETYEVGAHTLALLEDGISPEDLELDALDADEIEERGL